MTAALSRFERGVDYEIRAATPLGEEVAFILDSWRWASLRADAAHGVPKDMHFAEMTPRILATLPRCRVRVAYDMKDEGTLVGWAVLEGPTLHYVMVRRDFRRQGIARQLLAGERIEFFSAKPAAFRGAPAGWTYNPWAFVPTERG